MTDIKDTENSPLTEVTEIAKLFTVRTTIHGVQPLTRNKGCLKKSLWLGAILVMTAGLTYHSFILIRKYFSYPVIIVVDLDSIAVMDFPSVTVCNINPLRQSAWKAHLEALAKSDTKETDINNDHVTTGQETASCGNSDTCITTEQPLLSPTSTSTPQPDSETETNTAITTEGDFPCADVAADLQSCSVNFGSILDLISKNSSKQQSQDNTNTGSSSSGNESQSQDGTPKVREEFAAMDNILEELASLTDEERIALGHQSGDFILDCEYAGVTCNLRDFEVFANPVHGNCYIFNAWWNTTQIRKSYRPGHRHGLRLVLNLNQPEYMEETGDVAGARLLVHETKTMPFPEDDGIMLLPGMALSVGLKKLKLLYLDEPHGKCTDPGVTSDPDNVYRQRYPVLYNYQICRKSAYQQYLMDKCGCFDVLYPSDIRKPHIPVCKASNSTQDRCLRDIKAAFNNFSVVTNCHKPCRQESFSYTLSKATWPSDIQKVDVLTPLLMKAGYLLSEPDDLEAYTRNVIKVDVYYEHFLYETLREKPEYTFGRFLSDIGGILGLWLGCSFMTLLEPFELLGDLTVAACRRKPKEAPPRGRRYSEDSLQAWDDAGPYPKPLRDKYKYIFKVTEVEKQLMMDGRLDTRRDMLQY